MNLLQQLENAPKNIVLYVLGLIGAIVYDYTLLTLTIFCVLLGFVLGSVLIPITVFFGLYFLLRAIIGMIDAIYRLAQVTHEAGRAQAHSTMQVAGVLAQSQTGTVVTDDIAT